MIFITAHDSPETRDLAQRFGAAGYLRKPVDDQALLDAIFLDAESPAGCGGMEIVTFANQRRPNA